MGPAHPVLLAPASGVVRCTGGLQGVLRPLGISPGLYAPSPALFYIPPKFAHLAIMYLKRHIILVCKPTPQRHARAAHDLHSSALQKLCT